MGKLLIKPYKKIFTPNYDIQKIQAYAEETFNKLIKSDFIVGNYIDITIDVTDTIVNHLLQRKFKGWVVVDRDAPGIVYQSSTLNNYPDKLIILKATVKVYTKIYFF